MLNLDPLEAGVSIALSTALGRVEHAVRRGHGAPGTPAA